MVSRGNGKVLDKMQCQQNHQLKYGGVPPNLNSFQVEGMASNTNPQFCSRNMGNKARDKLSNKEVTIQGYDEQRSSSYIIFKDLLKSCMTQESNEEANVGLHGGAGWKCNHQRLVDLADHHHKRISDIPKLSQPMLRLSKAASLDVNDHVSLELTLA